MHVYMRHVLSALTVLEHIYTTMKTSNHAVLCTELLPFLLLHINDLVCQTHHIEHIHHTPRYESTLTEE